MGFLVQFAGQEERRLKGQQADSVGWSLTYRGTVAPSSPTPSDDGDEAFVDVAPAVLALVGPCGGKAEVALEAVLRLPAALSWERDPVEDPHARCSAIEPTVSACADCRSDRPHHVSQPGASPTQAGVRLNDLIAVSRRLCEQSLALGFDLPVTHVYQPLDYAWRPHSRYLERYGGDPKEILLLGMNPGPFGMAQTGVPFGDVGMVRDWLGIREPVERPGSEHPKRPVLGFDCPRSEVSGKRLWGWAQRRFGTPEGFFQRYFVWNYCPLSFMEASGRNRTPDRLPSAERRALFAVCDAALSAAVRFLCPSYVVGVGRFAADRAAAALGSDGAIIGTAPHPSPASPAANRGWEAIFEKALVEIGIRPLP